VDHFQQNFWLEDGTTMARVGNEFGSVTGRQGTLWMVGTVALKYTIIKWCNTINDDEKR
jgi:adenylosuccinate synthase